MHQVRCKFRRFDLCSFNQRTPGPFTDQFSGVVPAIYYFASHRFVVVLPRGPTIHSRHSLNQGNHRILKLQKLGAFIQLDNLFCSETANVELRCDHEYDVRIPEPWYQGALGTRSKLLLEISGGSLKTEVKRGRGHCHVIGNIYRIYLDKWFARVFKEKNDYESVKLVFETLGNADDDLFYDLEQLAAKLEKEAGDVLELVIKGQEKKARTRVLSALPVLQPAPPSETRALQATTASAASVCFYPYAKR